MSLWERGGTGRHTSLRNWRLNAWEFESPRSYGQIFRGSMLKYLWQLLIVGRTCDHKWKVIKVHYMRDQFERILRIDYVLQCEHCGAVKTRRIF